MIEETKNISRFYSSGNMQGAITSIKKMSWLYKSMLTFSFAKWFIISLNVYYCLYLILIMFWIWSKIRWLFEKD